MLAQLFGPAWARCHAVALRVERGEREAGAWHSLLALPDELSELDPAVVLRAVRIAWNDLARFVGARGAAARERILRVAAHFDGLELGRARDGRQVLLRAGRSARRG